MRRSNGVGYGLGRLMLVFVGHGINSARVYRSSLLLMRLVLGTGHRRYGVLGLMFVLGLALGRCCNLAFAVGVGVGARALLLGLASWGS